MKKRFFLTLYLLTIVLLFFYSFTQVDLGLTLTKASIFAQIQHIFQHIGYFNRPLSVIFFSAIVIFLFIFYGYYLSLAKRDLFTTKAIWIIVIVTAGILTFSYTAFSYDIFNYIFDAKIITYYKENPYLKKALDYPNDPMLGFMHWTHRTYPYGPIWLVFTVPLSFLGMQYFLPTYFLFKTLGGISYLLTIFAISRIMRVVAPFYEKISVVFFAFNPLVLIESLVTGHNDIVMMALAMLSILFLVRMRYVFAFLFLFLSIGIKYATGFLLPLYIAMLFIVFNKKKACISWQKIFLTFIIAMIFALIAAIIRSTFQPWYLLFVLPIVSLLPQRFFIVIPTFILSLVALLNYVPFLYTGNWDPPIPRLLVIINLVGILLSLLIVGFIFLLRQRKFTRHKKLRMLYDQLIAECKI